MECNINNTRIIGLSALQGSSDSGVEDSRNLPGSSGFQRTRVTPVYNITISENGFSPITTNASCCKLNDATSSKPKISAGVKDLSRIAGTGNLLHE